MKSLNNLNYWRLLLFALVAGFASCVEDDNPVTPDNPDEKGPVMITSQSGTTLVNDKTIEVGTVDGDVMFEMISTVMTDKGRVQEFTLNCCGMGALMIEDGVQDMSVPVENVTLINKGTINIHTHDLVEKYKDEIQTPTNPDRKYKYLRLLALYAGKNSQVVNDGTINVYFDHDPNADTWIYVMGMIPGEGSTVVNNGEIHFYGNGSVATRMRAVATFADNISVENHGVITADVEMADDTRAVTTGGSFSKVYNDGFISLRLPGTITCLTRYGDTELTNDGTIEITCTSIPAGHISITDSINKIACALYEPLQATRTGMPPMINRGTITMTIEGLDDPQRRAYGILFDLQGAGGQKLNPELINEGVIKVNNPDPATYEMAEAGFIARPNAVAGVCNITLNTWKTRLRDFSKTGDLFMARGLKMDFSQATLLLDADNSYVDGTSYSVAPEAIMNNVGGADYRFEYSGYDQMTIKAASDNYTLNWDKAAQTVSLEKK